MRQHSCVFISSQNLQRKSVQFKTEWFKQRSWIIRHELEGWLTGVGPEVEAEILGVKGMEDFNFSPVCWHGLEPRSSCDVLQFSGGPTS